MRYNEIRKIGLGDRTDTSRKEDNMGKEIRTTLWVEDGVTRVRAYITDFVQDFGSTWKGSFYELWRYQMTWNFAYEIKVHETSDKDVCVSMLVKNAYLKNVLDTMESLGYRNVQIEEEHIGIIQIYDIDDPVAEDMFTVVAE